MSHPTLTNWLLAKGIVKNESGSHTLMRGLVIFNLVVIAALVVLFYLAPMQNQDVNGFGIIHNEGASFVQMVHQSGWPNALAYLRFTSLVVVGDIWGALYSLWLPILVIVAALAAIFAFHCRRCQKQ